MRLLALLLACGALLAGEGRWKLKFFHDQDDSAFTLNDLKFASPTRGAACGFLAENGRLRPQVLVTADGGEKWSFVPTREVGLSLFFLNENAGWMVTPGGVWRTDEAGRNWRKLSSLKGVLRVHFLDEQRGFAVGRSKSVWRTTDGGAHWDRVEVLNEPDANPDHTAYTWITFANPREGVIAGSSAPPRRDAGRFPDWMDPQRAQRRRQWPSLNLALETRDGGATWKASSSSVFGQVTRVRFNAGGSGLALIEFFDAFEWPSEVFRIETSTGKSERVFRRKDRAVTDVLLPPRGPGLLASIEPAAMLRNVPVPGKLKMFESADLANWREMPADYRAEGRRAVLADAGPGELWVATDLGMILKLEDR